MKIGKKAISGIGLSVLTLSAIVGGAVKQPMTASAAADNVTNISFWYTWGGSDSQDLQKVIAEFNQTHKNIHVTGLGSQTGQKELTAMTGGTPPDVGYTYFPDIPKWGSVGAVLSLEPYMKKTNFNTKDIVPAVWKYGMYNGQHYAIPYTMDTYMLFYNKDLFKKAGITSPPKTISEMKKDAWKLTKMNANGYTQVGFIPDFPWLNMLGWRTAFGATIYDMATKRITINSPQNIASLNFERSFYLPPYNKAKLKKFESGFGKYVSPNNAFFAGQLGMDIEGEWLPTLIKLYAPNLHYGIAQIPYPDGHPELRNSGTVEPGMLFIPANAQHKDEAWTFIQWLVSRKPYVEFGGLKGSLPTTYSALNDPELVKLNPGMKPFVDYVKGKNIQAYPSVPFISEFTDSISLHDGKVLNLEETPQQAMANVVKEVEKAASK